MRQFDYTYNPQLEVPFQTLHGKARNALKFKVLLNTFIAKRKTTNSLRYEY
jgi:hypothetical protein